MYNGGLSDDGEPEIYEERLSLGLPDNPGETVLTRSEKTVSLKAQNLPKLPDNSSALYLLREDSEVKPAHEAFARIMRRNFFGDELNGAVAYSPMPANLIRRLEQRRRRKVALTIDVLFPHLLTLPIRLYLLKQYFKAQYDDVLRHYQRVFPFIEDFHFRKPSQSIAFVGDTPYLYVKERGTKADIAIGEMSSGMQKVLLIITDVMTAPPQLLYLIDEYENSLGINAIDFLPGFLNECGLGRQYIVTSHHPHLINAIPVSSWYVFHREGTEISVRNGEELEERYGRSRQARFTQLLNDPYFYEGGG
jgi:hypothetical protein